MVYTSTFCFKSLSIHLLCSTKIALLVTDWRDFFYMSKNFKQTKVHIFTTIIDIIKGILFLDQFFNMSNTCICCAK